MQIKDTGEIEIANTGEVQKLIGRIGANAHSLSSDSQAVLYGVIRYDSGQPYWCGYVTTLLPRVDRDLIAFRDLSYYSPATQDRVTTVYGFDLAGLPEEYQNGNHVLAVCQQLWDAVQTARKMIENGREEAN